MKNRQIWMWVGATFVFLSVLYLIQGILMPFLTGLLVAYAMNPAVKRFERWGISRTFATSIMVFSFFFLIGLFLFIAIPFIQTELLRLASRIPQYGDRILVTLQPYIDNASLYIKPEDANRLREFASSYFGDVITWGIKLLVKLLTSGLALANLLSLIVITPIVAFYFLRDWTKIIQAIDSWLPRPYEPTLRRLFTEMNNRIGGFAKGQSLVCLLVGTYYMIALTLAHLDFSVVVGMVIGVIAFIPYVGALVGFMLSMGIAFSQFSDWTSIGIIAGIFALGQVLEGHLFIPYFVGDRIGLHPVWVLFSLLVGGVLFGFIGILFALPVAAAMGVLVRHLLEVYLKSPYYLGTVPLKAD
ncbi:MAG: AI-2E family transporter [Alphaproteobacteria bacterium]|nr:AI-2E family transporter [Alphaproteobacteria bacterium]